MALRIDDNPGAPHSRRNLGANAMPTGTPTSRPSSGLRVHGAGDDAPGLAVSEATRTRIRGLDLAARNALDGLSLVQMADASMDEVDALLQHIRALALQAADGALTEPYRAYLDNEVQSMLAEINRVGTDTEFNGRKILAGAGAVAACAVNPRPGLRDDPPITFSIPTVSTTHLTINGLGVASADSAADAIASIDAAIRSVRSTRADLGDVQDRLGQTITRLTPAAEDAPAGTPVIRDAGTAAEMVQIARRRLLDQPGSAMLAQANQAHGGVLMLLS